MGAGEFGCEREDIELGREQEAVGGCESFLTLSEKFFCLRGAEYVFL